MSEHQELPVEPSISVDSLLRDEDDISYKKRRTSASPELSRNDEMIDNERKV
jgi:hypothetical protein